MECSPLEGNSHDIVTLSSDLMVELKDTAPGAAINSWGITSHLWHVYAYTAAGIHITYNCPHTIRNVYIFCIGGTKS